MISASVCGSKFESLPEQENKRNAMQNANYITAPYGLDNGSIEQVKFAVQGIASSSLIFAIAFS